MKTTHQADRLIDRWTILICLGVGAFMFWGAGHYTVFDDEARSCRLYAAPMGEMVGDLWRGVDPDPPLYYLLQNAWVHLFGVGPLGLRSLSIFFFLFGLVMLRAAGRAWFDARVGLLAMALGGLHPAHLFFGFAGRWYSLMFLMTAILLWLTARLIEAKDTRGRWIAAWALGAAGVCYTNYFGVVVVAVVWIVAILRSRGRSVDIRRWLWAGLGGGLLYAVWLTPLWHQMIYFQRPAASMSSYAAAAGRTTLALMAGNLASVGAWWVWAPMAIFGISLIVLMVMQWRRVWPIGVVVVACFVAGVGSRTMIDKYVMTFSGLACLLAAAVFVEGRQAWRRRWPRILTCTMAGGLALGWLGCGVNFVVVSHWSSLRWIDPFEQALTDLFEDEAGPPPSAWIMTHPSARYYFALLSVSRDSGRSRIIDPSPADWLKYAGEPGTEDAADTLAVGTPDSVMLRMVTGPVAEIITLETAGFVDSPEWSALGEILDDGYVVTRKRMYLEDREAALKDRLDPNVHHPPRRITVRHWALRR